MHTLSESDAHLICSSCRGIGPVTFSTLVRRFGSAKGAVLASEGSLERVLKPGQVQCVKTADISTLKERIKSCNIEYIAGCEETFPRSLHNIANPPIGLFIRGNKESFAVYEDNAIAVVGTRRPSVYGQSVAKWIVSSLVTRGLMVISGLAMGIDAVAHRATLENAGITVAVIAGGIDVGFPGTNRQLAQDIVKGGGCLISEHPPGMYPEPGMFVVRNRLIAGMARAIVVVEGSKTSGALATARFGVEQGKDIYAVPGQITSIESEAPHILIKEGAIPLLRPEDVLSSFSLKNEVVVQNAQPEILLTKEEKVVLDLFHGTGVTVDEITQLAGKSVSDILSTVSLLEVKGLLEKTQTGTYIRRLF